MLQQLEQRIRWLEQKLRENRYDTRDSVKTEINHRYRMELQSPSMPHLISALCVSTLDPFKDGQVKWFTPMLIAPSTQVDQLPWAHPISPFPGFDDSGCVWVPPAGSKIAILFENADRRAAYYIGSFWTRSRGLQSGSTSDPVDNRQNVWGINIPEYECIWEGSRDGYNLGSNCGDQDLPPWNTENYNGQDIDSIVDFSSNPNSQKLLTNPYIMGFKTPEKHYLKMVDGDHLCNHKWRRVELASGRGNILMMKDDHLHPCGEWAFNGPQMQGYAPMPCDGSNQTAPLENSCHALNPLTGCDEPTDGTDNCESLTPNNPPFANPFYKRKEEMRFYSPPSVLQQFQNNTCELPQSGIQLQSISGMQIVMDDSVDQPQGEPRWKLDFDFGCNDIFKGRMLFRTATGHAIEMNDSESETLLRGDGNGIGIVTATGNSIKLNDYTIGSPDQPIAGGQRRDLLNQAVNVTVPAGASLPTGNTISIQTPDAATGCRGITAQSTAGHILQFADGGNPQASPPRKEGGVPVSQANKAYILLRSGYGLQLLMGDDFDQQNTDQQVIQLLAPQKSNTERGPHMLVMQEKPDGPGLVMLRAGGVYYRSSYDDSIEVVGEDTNPSNKFVQVTNNYIVDVESAYFNHNDITIFQAEQYIILFAGRDCPLPPGSATATGQEAGQNAMDNVLAAAQGQPQKKGPCLFPVIVGKEPYVCPLTNYVHFGVLPDPNDPSKILYNSMSDRVFASASHGPTNQE
jgi:Type VI secretion system/phage-baseplate injector OB domain